MRINTNVMAYNAYRNLDTTDDMLANSLEKRSSGYRINRDADDPSVRVSPDLDKQISGLKVATQKAQNGISVVQTAQGALTQVNSMLERIHDLIVQSANTASSDSTARTAAQSEIVQLRNEIDRIGGTGAKVQCSLNIDAGNTAGTASGTATVANTAGDVFQDGANFTDTNQIHVSIDDVRISSGTNTTYTALANIDVTNTAENTVSAGLVDAAIASVAALRSQLGANENRLRSTIANLQVTTENLSASESRIRCTDMASEMVNFTRRPDPPASRYDQGCRLRMRGCNLR